MRVLLLLVAVCASSSAFAQMRQYGDPYAGGQQTVRMWVQQNQPRPPTYTPPVYRPPPQTWTPSVPNSWSSNRSGSSDRSYDRGSYVAPLPEAYLVPFDNPGGGFWQPSADPEDIVDLYVAPGGDPGRAVALARTRAAAGDTEAMVLLALASYQGRGLPADARKSFEWMSKAATANDTTAQTFLGEMYLYGVGVARDESQGLTWLQKAADAGEPQAALRYARALMDTGRAETDYSTALRYAQKAEAAIAEASVEAGLILTLGKPGVPADPQRGAAAFERAAKAGNSMGQYLIATCLRTGTGVAKDPLAAVAWLQKASDQGLAPAKEQLVDAQFNLGVAYFIGEGVTASDSEAMRWMALAADAGHSTAQYFMGLSSLRGIGVPYDVPLGIRRLQQSAAGGFTQALDQLCDEVTRTHGAVRLDSPEFTPTLAAGVAKDQPACLYVQAGRLYQGILGPLDQERALALLERAADAGYYNAELDYGRNFLALVGRVEASYDAELLSNARQWITRAADHGSLAAEQLLKDRGWR